MTEIVDPKSIAAEGRQPQQPGELPSAGSLDRVPPWSTDAEMPTVESAADSWNSGHPGNATIEDPPEYTASDPDAATQVNSSTSPESQTQEDRGQLKWE